MNEKDLEARVAELERWVGAVLAALEKHAAVLEAHSAGLLVLNAQFPKATLDATARNICACPRCRQDRKAAEDKAGVA